MAEKGTGAFPLGPVRVLIADDHQLFAKCLKMLLDRRDGIDVVGIASDGDEAVALASRLAPDIVLMDIAMRGTDGLEATRRLAESGSPVRVVVVSGLDRSENVGLARDAGAWAYITKETAATAAIETIFRVASNRWPELR
jgi:DNA-binding NarL/FixJ family response regulator